MVTELAEFAAEQQRLFDAATSPQVRKERGHFGTPPPIAQFMARMFPAIPVGIVRILDPGAGVGTLSAALCQRVLQDETSRHLSFELWENDPKLECHLRLTMDQCQKSLRNAGHLMEYRLRSEDFILANARKSLFDDGPSPAFHLAILNPPYYKVRKDSPQAMAMEHVIHGQPNIYGLFMAVAAELLLPGGEMVAITPRSYFNGPYFKRFRRWFFDRLTVRRIHVFESRTDAFEGNEVLQENVILLGEKAGKPSEVQLTSSIGRGFDDIGHCEAPYAKVIDNSSGDRHCPSHDKPFRA